MDRDLTAASISKSEELKKKMSYRYPGTLYKPDQTHSFVGKKIAGKSPVRKLEKIYDIELLGNEEDLCPYCDCQTKPKSAAYYIQIEGIPWIYISQLAFCEECGSYYGTLEWLDTLQKEIIDEIGQREISLKYHNAGQSPTPAQRIARKRMEESYSFKSSREVLRLPDSTIAFFKCSKEGSPDEEYLAVVNDPAQEDKSSGIFYSMSQEGEILLKVALNNCHRFTIRRTVYSILMRYPHPQIYGFPVVKEQLINSIEKSEQLVDVYVYRRKMLCRNHREAVQRLVVNMIGAWSNALHPLEVYYCPVCEKFYINERIYREFSSQYGFPPLRLHMDERENGLFDTSNLRDNHELSLCGYTVRADSMLGNHTELRHALLRKIIDMGVLTKAEIIEHLEFLIMFSEKNPNNAAARKKWTLDLDYVESYKQNQTKLKGRFVPGRR